MTTFNCGHPRTPENTRLKKDGRGRFSEICRECYNANDRRRAAARRAAQRGGGRNEPRLPAEPLFRYIALNQVDVPAGIKGELRHARGKGWVDETDADRLAVALGTHPGLLWDEWWLPVEECA